MKKMFKICNGKISINQYFIKIFKYFFFRIARETMTIAVCQIIVN